MRDAGAAMSASEAAATLPASLVSGSACRDADPELFFPIGSSGPALRQLDEARAICARCLVLRDCLTYALETGQDAGVWGGTSEQERRALRAGLVGGRDQADQCAATRLRTTWPAL
jgi:WhiB family redox-sensing transcriptional regulator